MEQQTTKRTLKYDFSNEERLELGRDLSQMNQKLRQLEDEKKSVVSEFGSRIAIVKEQISSLSDKVASGYEMRDTIVTIDYHMPERGKKTLTRTDTGESWVEPMNNTDHDLFNQWEMRELENAQDDEGELSDDPNVEDDDTLYEDDVQESEPDTREPNTRQSNGRFTKKVS